MKFLRHLTLILFLFSIFALNLKGLQAAPAQIDILYLKTGPVIVGTFLDETPTGMRFRTAGTTRVVPFSRISRLYLAYTGVPFCYSLIKTPKKRECSGKLLFMGKTNLRIVSKNKLKIIKLKKIQSLNVIRAKKEQKLIPLLDKGLNIHLKLKSKSIFGRIRSLKNDSIVLKSAQGSRKITEADIQEVFLLPALKKNINLKQAQKKVQESLVKFKKSKTSKKPRRRYSFQWNYLVPGLAQWRRGDKKTAIAIIAGLSLAGAGGAYEYNATLKAVADGNQDLASQLFFNDRFVSTHQRHLANQRAYGGAALLIYGIHILDAIFRTPVPGGDALKSSAGAMEFHVAPTFTARGGTGLRFQLSFRF